MKNILTLFVVKRKTFEVILLINDVPHDPALSLSDITRALINHAQQASLSLVY